MVSSILTPLISFLDKKVPNYHSVTYASLVWNYKPIKSEPYFLRCVAVGENLDYPDDPGSPADSLIETKLLLKSTISDAKKVARLMSCDLKYLFLALLMDQEEYVWINLKHFHLDIIQWYNLHEK